MRIFTLRLFALALLASLGSTLTAQTHHVCGSDELRDQNLQQNPQLRAIEEASERRYVDYINNIPGSPSGRVVKTIPVVVHVVQSSAVVLLDDAEIQSQIDVLNEDYRKMAGTNGDGSGVDTEYEFCLASIDPNGCPTPGINRLVNPAQAFHDRNDPFSLKSLIQWDPNKYLNVWVPRTIEGNNGLGSVIGYATFPSGMLLQPELDGIVVHSEFFGRNSSPQYLGRTTTHEVGHWLGLFHPFQGGCSGATAATCASSGDRVCDTPQSAAANFNCPNNNSCTDTPTDLPDMIENYMEYSDGTCQDMFTQGQKDRMDFHVQNFRPTLVSAANLTATGCDGTVSPGCAPTAAFASDVTNGCVGQAITFSDLSSGPATGWNWTFQGGTPATSTAQIPTVTYAQPGNYTVSLEATNNLGADTETITGYIEITEADINPVEESFEGILFYPQGWFTTETNGTPTWTLNSAATSSDGINCMVVENYDAENPGAFANLTSRVFDMSNVITGQLSFDYAYKRYNGFQIDTFAVRVSDDCGSTWQTAWSESGVFLPTIGGNAIASGWSPTDTAQWKTITVDIDSMVMMQPDVRFQFRVISANGQNLYLDNIRVTTTLVNSPEAASPNWSVSVHPNPFQDELNISYELVKGTDVHFVLTDVNGKVIMDRATGKQAPGVYSLTDQTQYGDLPSGIYFLRVDSDFGSVTKKLVKMGR